MKAVLISIQPKWWHKIIQRIGKDFFGKPKYLKRLELRKTKPKYETPFKVYVYETKTPLRWNKSHTNIIGGEGGYVVGEFVCDYILRHCEMSNADIAEEQGCVLREDILKYSNGKEVFGWHISDLVIYDKPKELSEFYTIDNEAIKKCEHRERVYNNPNYTNGAWLLGSYICNKDEPNWCEKCKTKPLTKPPQSWCFVEELVGDNNA